MAKIGGEATGCYQFKKEFYGLFDMPTIFQDKIDKTIEHKIPAWKDDIIAVKRSTAEDHMQEVGKVLEKLEKSEQKSSKQKSKIFKADAEWLGYKTKKA